MEITITLPDNFAERLQRCGTTPEDYVKLLVRDAMRRGAERERKSRPADTKVFIERSAASAAAQMHAEDAKQLADLAAAQLANAQKDAGTKDTNLPLPSSVLPISTSGVEH